MAGEFADIALASGAFAVGAAARAEALSEVLAAETSVFFEQPDTSSATESAATAVNPEYEIERMEWSPSLDAAMSPHIMVTRIRAAAINFDSRRCP